MKERKQGRRSAQTAEDTKKQILTVAGKMFCQLGYEKVTLRHISDQAGISHSLIRHHFGSKEQIWYAVSDYLHFYMTRYMTKTIQALPADKPANVIYYHFLVKSLAHMLVVPYPMQFISDAIRQNKNEFIEYLIDKSGQFASIMKQIVAAHNRQNPDYCQDWEEQKWILFMHAHGAISLQPMMEMTWKERASTDNERILLHWQIYNRLQISQLNIPAGEVLNPKELTELILPVDCVFSQ